MALLDFISFDDVRAALGVSSDEITDTTLSLDLYEFNLVSELESIGLTLIADYEAQKASAPDTWTEEQTRFHQAVKLFSAYAVAKQATVALPMFSPKEQTDGKAALVRFAQNPYKDTIAAILQAYDVYRTKLEAAYGVIKMTGTPEASTRPYFIVATPAYDPVTGA
jgi:hypothetical protein